MLQFDFNLDELDGVFSYAEEFMGFESGKAPEPFSSYMAEAYEEMPALCNVSTGYVVIDNPVFKEASNTIVIDGISFNPGKIVFNQLKGSEAIGFFLASAGQGISRRITGLTQKGDHLLSYVYDAFGSVIVQKAVDKLIDRIEESARLNGWGISDPFSPGYCDWSVSEQQLLFTFFPEGFCGVTLSESSLMMPLKSVSGIIGMGKTMQQKGYQCMMCNDENCFVGRILKMKYQK